jgi:hypothetical protein
MKRIAGFGVMAATASLVVAGAFATAGNAYAGPVGHEEVVTEQPVPAPAPVVEEKVEKPFRPSINCGAGVGYADQSDAGGDFGWNAWALARLHKYGGIQLEYWSLGNATQKAGGGHFDGLYVGVMPMFPILDTGLNIFGQVGGAFSDEGNDVAGGGGLLYSLPISWLNKNNVDLLLRLDYKYFHITDDDKTGQHLISFGFMVGFHK